MKKYLVLFFALLITGTAIFYSSIFDDKSNAIYVIALDENSKDDAENIYKSIKKENRDVVLSNISGNYNFYVASDYNDLPKNINKEAINILYIPYFSDKESPELLRDFDVIVVKSAKSFGHLQAINARTAYIPNIVDIVNKDAFSPNEKIAYIGDDEDFSLSLHLIKNSNFSIDIYGKVNNSNLGRQQLKASSLNKTKYKEYSLVLIDQTEEDIDRNIVSDKLLKIISNGGIPFVRYNPGIVKMFGNAIPMYYNPEHFNFELYRLLQSPIELKNRFNDIVNISTNWSSSMRAKKIIELFDIMKKKRI